MYHLFLILSCGLSLLFPLHCAYSAPYNYEQIKVGIHPPPVNNNTSKQDHANSSVNSQKTFDIVVHGILLWAAMGFLMPIGILVMRMSSTTNSHHTRHKILFNLHAIFQALSVLVVTIGAVLSIRNFENAFNNAHQRIGLALYAAVYLQILIGFRRPKRGSRGRCVWYFIHWILGTTISLVGMVNIYTGLEAYHKKTSKSRTLWTIMFTVQVSLMAILYLFQDKWEYIQKKGGGGVVPCDGESEMRAAADLLDNEKEIFNEPAPSFKTNALGTYFSRTNALHKLFQLT